MLLKDRLKVRRDYYVLEKWKQSRQYNALALIFKPDTDLIVIHNCVERLDPHRVNVPIKNNPFGPIMCDGGQLSHGGGEHP